MNRRMISHVERKKNVVKIKINITEIVPNSLSFFFSCYVFVKYLKLSHKKPSMGVFVGPDIVLKLIMDSMVFLMLPFVYYSHSNDSMP